MIVHADPSNNFIDPEQLSRIIDGAGRPAPSQVREIIARGLEKKGLSLPDVAVLLQSDDAELDAEIFAAARRVKQEIYGNRIVLFAPLYVSNECANQCSYCGFNAKNRELVRKTLTSAEIAAEVRALEDSGQKRLLLVYGEHPKITAEWIADSVTTVYETLSGKSGAIRRVNINCAPLDVAGFKLLHQAGIGTYQCFQETYHQPTYEKMHLAGNKTDYLWRLQAMHRAQQAGIDDVGIGVLFGLYDHRFELLAMLRHAEELENRWGAGPHTISFPRMEPALGSELSQAPPYLISDHIFKKIVATTRLAVPYTGIIMSTRESGSMRTELLQLGVSQMSAGSSTSPGGYSDGSSDDVTSQQFSLGDHRKLDDIVLDLVRQGFTPSWCTACYRTGRTGEHFMTLAKEGFIQNFCHPNALLTLKEYLNDYGSTATVEAGKLHIAGELEACQLKVKPQLEAKLTKIEAGERDLYV